MATPTLPKKILARQNEITQTFLLEIDKHLADIVSGRVTEMFEIRDVAALMHLHPTHLSNTIKIATGKSPCYFFEKKIMDIAKKLLETTQLPAGEIATMLTFDPSNFAKFFKRFARITPKQYREAFLAEKYGQSLLAVV